MTVRNVIPGLRKIDWSDVDRQNEFLNGVISAMGCLNHSIRYDDVAALSGCAFRACSPKQGMDPGVYQVTHDSAIIPHTFRMLGYQSSLSGRSDYATDRRLITDSIDRGVPVLTFRGVIPCSECCIIAGYDEGGDVLLGWSPFMHIPDDHNEPHDETGYFRKSRWHEGHFKDSNGKILVIGKPLPPVGEAEAIARAIAMAVALIRGTASSGSDALTGYAGHTRFAELVCQDTQEWFPLELMIVCNACNLYQDKVHAAPFLRKAARILKDRTGTLDACAALYDRVTGVREQMKALIPEDLSMGRRILDPFIREQYANCIRAIRDLEKEAADRLEA